MNERDDERRTPNLWLWLVLGIAIIAAGSFAYDWMQRPREEIPAARSSPSTEWTTAPQGSRVPVDLPETEVTATSGDGTIAAQPPVDRSSPSPAE